MEETLEESLEEVQELEADGTVDPAYGGAEMAEVTDMSETGIPVDAIQPDMKIYKSFKCHLCRLYFSRLHSLKAHTSVTHPELDFNNLYRTTTFKCSEPRCKYVGKTRTDLLGHLYQEHDFLLHKVEGEFNNEDDFTIFFERLQKAHKVRFVKKRGRSFESTTQYFVCSRDGYVKTGRGKWTQDVVRKRNATSHKIGTFCTAHVTVRHYTDGRITIEGYTTHYNHVVEGRRLALLDSERKFIKYHAQRGMSIRDIIDLIQQTIGANVSDDDPLHYLNARTVRNVINSVNVEVPDSATELFNRVNGSDLTDLQVDEAAKSLNKTRGAASSISLAEVVRGHDQSLLETYNLILEDDDSPGIRRNQWMIQGSKDSMTFRVDRLRDKCLDEESGTSYVCPVTCVYCKQCAHLYKCSCPSKNPMCEHIHAICQYLLKTEAAQEESPDQAKDDQSNQEIEQMCVDGNVEDIQLIHVQPDGTQEVRIVQAIQQPQLVAASSGHDITEQHVEVTQLPMNHSVQPKVGQNLVTSLVFHDYERRSPEATKTAIDPSFVSAIDAMKEHLAEIEMAIENVDLQTAGDHLAALKDLIPRTDSPKLIRVSEYEVQ